MQHDPRVQSADMIVWAPLDGKTEPLRVALPSEAYTSTRERPFVSLPRLIEPLQVVLLDATHLAWLSFAGPTLLFELNVPTVRDACRIG